MGYCPYYQAIPEQCDLFHRLESDRKMLTLLAWIFPYGSRPLDLRELDSGELNAIFDDVAEDSGAFESRADVDRAFTELRDIIDRADANHPGLIGRTAFLEKSQHQIEDGLVGRLGADGHKGAKKFVRALLYGEFSFSSGTGAGRDLMIVEPTTVQRAAQLLRKIGANGVFGDVVDGYPAEDYEEWRSLYLEAAARGEAVLVS